MSLDIHVFEYYFNKNDLNDLQIINAHDMIIMTCSEINYEFWIAINTIHSSVCSSMLGIPVTRGEWEPPILGPVLDTLDSQVHMAYDHKYTAYTSIASIGVRP